MMLRRGFTLLEVTLAAAMGGVILLACVGIFGALDRSDRLLEARAEQSGDLQRMRLVMQRTFMRIVTSDAPKPFVNDGRSNPARRPGQDADATPPPPRLILENSRISQIATMTSEKGLTLSPQRLEVVLIESPVPTAKVDEVEELLAGRVRGGSTRRSDREKTSNFSKGSGGAAGSASRSGIDGAGKAGGTGSNAGESKLGGSKADGSKLGGSRLEAPSLGSSGLDTKGLSSTGGAGKLSDAIAAAKDRAATAGGGGSGETDGDDDDEMTVRCTRGAFELRPQELNGRQRATMARRGMDGVTSWELWWVPLKPRVPEGVEPPASLMRRPLDEPTLVASNIRSLQWKLFDDRKKKTTGTATWQADLPAYVEVMVETTAGLKAEWMFEVDWATGSEVPGARAAANQGVRDTPRATPVDEGGKPPKPVGGGSK
jgi:prepilin-type N-terminal cleavage/methylation domain-containing protein